MADFYSNLFKGPAGPTVGNPTNPVGPFAYQGPAVLAPGTTCTVYGFYQNLAANPLGATAGDILHLCGVPEQSKLVNLTMINSVDMDTVTPFTFNLGYTSTATAFAAASTALQATTAFTLLPGVLLPVTPALFGGAPQELILTRTAGLFTLTGFTYFLAEFAAGNSPTN
jgi:hypothetical protein